MPDPIVPNPNQNQNLNQNQNQNPNVNPVQGQQYQPPYQPVQPSVPQQQQAQFQQAQPKPVQPNQIPQTQANQQFQANQIPKTAQQYVNQPQTNQQYANQQQVAQNYNQQQKYAGQMQNQQYQGTNQVPQPNQPQYPQYPGKQPVPNPYQKQPNLQNPQLRRPGMPVRRPPNPRRFLYGILGFFGCSIFLFILFVLLFVSQISPTGENALARSLGLDTASFIGTIITLVNVVFGFISIILFLVAIVGLFRIAMARKDDKEAKKRGVRTALAAGGLLVFMVFIWMFTYLFLSSKSSAIPRNVAPVTAIVTDPANTRGLVAPITVKFDGTRLPIDRKYEILSFLWDFGDGETSTLQSPSHTFKDLGRNNGRYDVKVTVSLLERATGSETTQEFSTIVTITSVEVNAAFTVDTDKGTAPLRVKFDASGSSAPSGRIEDYEWDFNDDNVFTDASGAKVEHVFEQVGKYQVNLRVTDNTGLFDIVSKEITVEGPNLPTAVIDIPTTDGYYFTSTQYTFLGENSTSPNGRITKYEWDFGDQTPKATTRTATHSYQKAGTYEIILTVTDEKNEKGETRKKINVQPAVGAPLAAFTTIPAQARANDGYISGKVPFEVKFDGSKSTVENSTIVDWRWDFDGDGKEDAAGPQATYVYTKDGTYNAQLKVIDAQNKEATTVLVVRVAPQGLQADLVADPVSGEIPLTVTFDASGSSYPTGRIGSYEWDFGDGTKRIDASKVTYRYDRVGTFEAKVTAIASDGSKSTVSLPINVRPVAMKACFEPSVKEGPAPLTVEFETRCSTGTITKWNWNFGDGEISRTRKPTHTFANPGSYTVTLEVADAQNVIDTFSMDILVTGEISN